LTTDPGEDPTAKVKLDAKKPGPWAGTALQYFWPAAERIFWRLVTPERCDTPPHRPFVDAALDALDEAIGTAARADVRVARARSRARAVLFAVLPPDPDQ
jgi:CRISPR system Cascade subunit CasA